MVADGAGMKADAGPGRPPSPFCAAVWLRRADVARMLEALSVIARGAPPAVAGRPGVLDRLRCRAEVALGRGVVVGDGEATEIGVGDGLDLAAELLECADLLADGGEGVAAFCLEGIEGRLLEALLDAGPLASESPVDRGR